MQKKKLITRDVCRLKSAEDYAAKQDAETWDYKNLRREMGCAVYELVRAVEPVEIKIEVAIEKPREAVLDASTQLVDVQDSTDDDVPL